MPSDPFALLAEVAATIDPGDWALVGGLMVHCHAQRSGIQNLRPTDDADIVVELDTCSYAAHAEALEAIGFFPHDSVDPTAHFHRFTRNEDTIDLMVSDRLSRSLRHLGRDLLRVPGSGSALKRTISHELPGGAQIRLPDLASAVSLKGAAHQVPGVNPVRHLQDAVTLLACAGPDGFDPPPSKSMRANINRVVTCLASSTEAWALAAPRNRIRASQCLRVVRPDWETPAFLTLAATVDRRRRP